MSETQPISAGANPFTLRTVLILVLFGVAVFVLLLWMIGAGMMSGPANNGGNHAEGHGLNGFAAFSQLLEKQGHEVRQSRGSAALSQPGLLVLTPPHSADPEQVDRMIGDHRHMGPTLLILPKWQAVAVPAALQAKGVKKGWVMLGPAGKAPWTDKIGTLGPLDVANAKGEGRWSGFAMSGALPDPKQVQSMSSGRIVALARDSRGQALAGYLDDGGDYPALAAAAQGAPSRISGSDLYPVVVVAEPDLLNNYGFARQESAMLAMALVTATLEGDDLPITFDLTLNGLGRTANLLTLAFTPPFLAATLCLLMAGLAVGWRAFLRFGPPVAPQRAIAFGKAALVANAAGLVRRTGRLHLVTGPYADRARNRIVRALGLPRQVDDRATELQIDRAQASRAPDMEAFSDIAARLRSAHRGHDVVKAAQELHALERKLTG